MEYKLQCPHPDNGEHHRGYSGVGREKIVQQVYDPDAIQQLRQVPDVKESFECGNEASQYYNIWPQERVLPGFRAALLSMYWVSPSTRRAARVLF